MNKSILFLILLTFIFILPYPSNAEDNYIIDGNTVYIDDENVYLSAQPHTIYESGYVYFNLISKNYNGNIDATLGFNTSLVKPKKAELYNENTNTWQNFPLSFTLLSYPYQNCDKWFYIKDIPIISNKNYMIRIWMNLPITTNINKGKYLFAVKPSFEIIQQSINNNRLYVLDPWFNTSFTDRQKIIITTNGSTIPQNYQILLNVTYNSNMQSDFDDLRFTNYTNGELAYWIESKINSEYALVWIELSDEIIHPNNDIIYMYYGDNQVNNKSNGSNTFIQYHGYASSNFLNNVKPPYTNISIHIKWNRGITTNTWWGLGTILSDSGGDQIVFKTTTTNYGWYYWKKNNGGTADVEYGDPGYDTKPHITIINYINDTVTLYIDDIHKGTSLSNDIYKPDENMGLGMYIYAGTASQEFSFVKKLISNEPNISYDISQYYSNTLYYNTTSNYNHTIESDGTIIVNRSLSVIDNTYWTAKSSNITYWIFTKEINSSGYTNFTIENDNLNNFTVKLKQYSYYNLNNSSLVNTFYTNQYGIANININLISDNYYIKFINQSLIPPPIKPLYPIHPILIFKDDICINNINKIIVYKNNSYIGIYNYSDEIIYLNNTNYTFFINSDNIDIINSENFLITFFKNYGYILISIIGIIILIGICIYFFKKVKR